MTLPLLLATLACGPGPIHLSTITDTRVIAIQGSPPEPGPGETTRLTATVANPRERELEILLWTCVPWEGRCLEEDTLPSLSDQAGIVSVAGGSASTTHRVPEVPWPLPEAVLDGLLAAEDAPAEIDSIPVQVSALACPRNECDVVNRVRGGLRRDDATGGSIGRDLRDPRRWMVDLPLRSVSLATKTLRIARPDHDVRNRNPVVEARWLAARDDVLVMDRDVPYELAFFVDDPDRDTVRAYGYTTLGRFHDRSEEVEDNAVRLYLLPEEAGRGELWVVFEDDEGGTTVWEKDIRIR